MSALMLFHVTTGTIAVACGFITLFAAKGAWLHRRAGQGFVVTMLLMASAGAVIAWRIESTITVLAGVLTCYLVASSWLTLQRQVSSVRAALLCCSLVALVVAAGGLLKGMAAADSPDGLADGFPAAAYFFFAAIAAIALAGDLVFVYLGGLQGRKRIARHLWRMCLALYIAAGSLFTGPGQQVFSQWLQESGYLAIPENTVALLMVFWLLRLLSGWQARHIVP